MSLFALQGRAPDAKSALAWAQDPPLDALPFGIGRGGAALGCTAQVERKALKITGTTRAAENADPQGPAPGGSGSIGGPGG